eukprot:TRINITY_DN25518_c0_g1_i1.p1 TRINITY_DN25518_c0_g1~~TRINITY_DN25518_c0_g1_i1.p1  ORF type:complete len:196 (+),score=34.28 TRINITY_DN25518_c0_g1_i1:91-678(+)
MIRRPPRSTQGVSSAASDVYKRQVYITGGDTDPREVKKYTESTNSMGLLKQMENAHKYHCMLHVSKNTFWVIAGRDTKKCEEYSISENKWSPKPDLTDILGFHNGIRTSDHILYIFGGERKGTNCNIIEYFDLKHSQEWKILTLTQNDARNKYNPMLIEMPTKEILIFAGHFSSCLLYTSPSPRDLSTSRMPSSA